MSTVTPEPAEASSSTQVPTAEVAAREQPSTAAAGLLRFSTAGSVDDGKSTLIGRLLYDSKGVLEDQLASVQKSTVNRSSGPIDFSLLTDGLRAEREQGITIDVAYRYFSTPRRKFIIADTPGHEQYTRNMATGASTAEAAIILIDARKGVLRAVAPPCVHRASARHAAHRCRRQQDGSGRLFAGSIRPHLRRISRVCRSAGNTKCLRVPVSALDGDNVVRRSKRMPWFEGPALLEHLESLPAGADPTSGPLRFPVQYVIRPDASFRGFAGQVASGEIRPGASVMALPSGVKTRVQSIVTFDDELESAGPGSRSRSRWKMKSISAAATCWLRKISAPPPARNFRPRSCGCTPSRSIRTRFTC